MACPDRLSQWTHEVSTAFAHRSCAQRWGLALWSAGIALAGASGLAQVSALLSAVLGEPEQRVFQRLREWYLDKEQKSGKKRRELDVTTCFAPLLGWVVRLMEVLPGEKGRLAWAVDATTLRNQWTILAVSVLVAGCAVPVAWKVLPGFAGRVLASLLGSVAEQAWSKRSSRLGGDRARRSRLVRPLALGLYCGAGMASVFARQPGIEGPRARQPRL